MKTSTLLITAAVITPAAVILGLGAAAAISIATVTGVGAIALNDYGKAVSYSTEMATATAAKKIERLPLAA